MSHIAPRLTLCPDCGNRSQSSSKRCDKCGTWLISIDHLDKEQDPLIGKSIDDRFIITELIAKGGMGAVYKAYQGSVDRHIVVKVLHPQFVQREDSIQRFFREAKAASRLNHHHIVQIYDFGQAADGMLYMMMEYLDGTLLYDLMGWGPIAPARTINILGQVMDALTVAHERGVIHRDLKPENIFLLDRAGATDFVKVFDFGIAKTDSSTEDPGKRLTSEKSIFGTPHYMSPEQALGEPPDPRSDIYALGIILFEMMAGAHPFESDDPLTLLRQHLRDTLPPLTSACPDFVLPPEIDDVFARLVAKNPDNRPANAREAKALLFSVFKDISGRGYNVSEHTPLPLPSERTTVEMESALPMMSAQARERENQFIEIMTHELRTALTVVSSSVELMADEKLGELTGKQGQFLHMIKRNIDRMSRFSTNVLSLSRLDSNKYNINLNELSLKAAIEQPLHRLKREALDKGISVVLDGNVDPALKVVADPGAVSLVVSNLVSNVLLPHARVTQATIAYAPVDEHFVEVWITDDGPGIPEADLEDLFDRFYQAAGESMLGFRGTGIRLAVCKALVEHMDGRISVESPGEGTTFRFTLPTPLATREFLFGKIAVLAGHMEQARLEEAVAAQLSQENPREKLGEILIKRGDLTRIELQQILEAQQERLSKPHSHLPVSQADGLFGKLALKYMYVTRQQLNQCVCLQEAARARGESRRLGQVLVQQDHMGPDEVINVLNMQKVRIAACSSCSGRYNVVRTGADDEAACPACGAGLTPETAPNDVGVEGDVTAKS